MTLVVNCHGFFCGQLWQLPTIELLKYIVALVIMVFGIVFQALFNKGLSVLSMGFYSVIELVSSLPDIIRIERPFPNGDWLLFLAEKSKRGTAYIIYTYFSIII